MAANPIQAGTEVDQPLRSGRLRIGSAALIPALLILPNLAWVLLPANEAPQPGSAPLAPTIIENAARAAVLVIPLFLSLDFRRRYSKPVAAAMGLALGIY